MAEEQDQSSKTEEPTTKKLEDGRKKGQVATSKEVNSWFTLLTASIMVLAFAPQMLSSISTTMITFFALPHQISLAPDNLGRVVVAVLEDLGIALAIPMIMLIAGAVLSGIVQNGVIFSTDPLKPKLERVSPVSGAKRLFSMKSLVEFLKGVAKLVIVATIALLVLMPAFDGVEHFAGLDLHLLLDEIRLLIMRMLIAVLAVMSVIMIADVMYQRHSHHQQMRMTKQEVKDEHKTTEGDPMIKQRLRQLRMEKSRRRMMAAVPTADVVITNPTHFAVALKYDQAMMAAPALVAKGTDLVAKRIRELADENDVPIVENPPLARALFAAVDVDQEIPPDHYKAVAEVISYVYALRAKGR